jgi:hypothetical protein
MFPDQFHLHQDFAREQPLPETHPSLAVLQAGPTGLSLLLLYLGLPLSCHLLTLHFNGQVVTSPRGPGFGECL